MSTTNRMRPRTAALIALGTAAAAAAAGIALAGGADASGTAQAAWASTRVAEVASAQDMSTIWSQSSPATQEYLCTAFLSDPDGTWQVLAPVLTAHDVSRAEAEAHLSGACSPDATVAALRR